jgi:hypothetical protein
MSRFKGGAGNSSPPRRAAAGGIRGGKGKHGNKIKQFILMDDHLNQKISLAFTDRQLNQLSAFHS